jgi:N-acetylglutamate synthase-like GNAT family acetyltransferase
MPLMIMKAFTNSKAVGIEAKILDKGIIEDLLARANMQAKALEAKIPQS